MLFQLVPGDSQKLEQLEFKLEKILGFRNMQEKLENIHDQLFMSEEADDDGVG